MTDLNSCPLEDESSPEWPCLARRRGDSGFMASWKSLEDLLAQTPPEAIALPEWESMPLLESEWPLYLPER